MIKAKKYSKALAAGAVALLSQVVAANILDDKTNTIAVAVITIATALGVAAAPKNTP